MSARTLTCKTLTCQVTAVEDLNPDVFKVTLAGRAEAMQHAPGQYLELMLDEATWVPFSIASCDRGDGTLELQIQHWPERDNSQRLRQLLQVANHQQLNSAEREVSIAKPAQRIVDGVQQVGAYHAYLVNYQQIHAAYDVYFFPAETIYFCVPYSINCFSRLVVRY